MSLLNDRRIQRVDLTWHRYGTARARVETIGGAVPAGPATLTIADLVMPGTVLPGRNGDNGPGAWVGIFETGAGWDTVLPATRPPYQVDAGVRLKSILTDLAVDCGMSVALPADASVGAHWCRARRGGDDKPRTGRDELNLLVKRRHILRWWLDLLGVTRFDVRATGPVKATARVIDRHLDRGVRILGIESPLAFAPGGTFEGATIETLVVHEDGGSLTCETWTS
jgi:hypothetical protein